MKFRVFGQLIEIDFCNGTWGLWIRGDRPVSCSDLCVGPFHLRWRTWGGAALPWNDRPPQMFNCRCWPLPDKNAHDYTLARWGGFLP